MPIKGKKKRMHKETILLIIFFIFLFLASFTILSFILWKRTEKISSQISSSKSTSPPPPPPYKVFISGNFSIAYPNTSEWQDLPNLPPTVKVAKINPQGCQIIIGEENKEVLYPQKSFKEIVEEELQKEKKQVDNLEVVREEWGENEVLFEINSSLRGNEYRYLSKGILLGEKIFSVVALAPKDNFLECKKEGEKILASIKILK